MCRFHCIGVQIFERQCFIVVNISVQETHYVPYFYSGNSLVCFMSGCVVSDSKPWNISRCGSILLSDLKTYPQTTSRFFGKFISNGLPKCCKLREDWKIKSQWLKLWLRMFQDMQKETVKDFSPLRMTNSNKNTILFVETFLLFPFTFICIERYGHVVSYMDVSDLGCCEPLLFGILS